MAGQAEELRGGSQVEFSGFTAAAQYGLHLSVTHKPFRAATASPELLLRILLIFGDINTLHLPGFQSQPVAHSWAQTYYVSENRLKRLSDDQQCYC